jgi:hypothetical protein
VLGLADPSPQPIEVESLYRGHSASPACMRKKIQQGEQRLTPNCPQTVGRSVAGGA